MDHEFGWRQDPCTSDDMGCGRVARPREDKICRPGRGVPLVCVLSFLVLVLVSSLALTLTTPPLQAQTAPTPRALGMGGAFITFARGQESLWLNPANLGLPETPRWSVAFPQGAVTGRLLGSPFGNLSDIIRANELSTRRRDQIFDNIPDSGVEGEIDLRLPLLAAQFGSFGFGVSYSLIGDQSLAKDVVELLWYGREAGRADYAAAGTDGSYATFWEVAAAYGRPVGPISIGVTGRYIRGGTITNGGMLDPELDLVGRDLVLQYVGAVARGGNGYGIDVGVAWQPSPSVTLGGTIANVLGAMSWSSDSRVRDARLHNVDFEGASLRDLLDRYDDSERAAEPGDTLATSMLDALLEEAFFPTEVHIGAGWRATPTTDVGVAWRNALTDGNLAGGWGRAIGIGAQQKLTGFLAVRAGIATNLSRGSMLAGGLSLGSHELGVVELGVARTKERQADDTVRSGWIATAGVSIKR